MEKDTDHGYYRGHGPMRFGMTLDGHRPEESKEADSGEAARPKKSVGGGTIFPTKPDGKRQAHRVADQKLKGKILQQILDFECRIPLKQMVLNARKIVVDLPQDVGNEENQRQETRANDLRVFQQPKIGQEHEANHQNRHIFAVEHRGHSDANKDGQLPARPLDIPFI